MFSAISAVMTKVVDVVATCLIVAAGSNGGDCDVGVG